MDRWTAIRQAAASTLDEYEQRTGRSAFTAAHGSYAVLEEIAKRCFHLGISNDPDLGANVSGQLNPDEEMILVRPGLLETRRRVDIHFGKSNRTWMSMLLKIRIPAL